MSAPASPSLTSLTTEALKMSGYSSPSAAQLTIAADFVEQIKNDIWMRCKTLKSLQTDAVMIVDKGKSRYSMPTDFSHLMTMTLLDGTVTGTAQGGAVGSITLAATESSTEGYLQGKDCLITAGTAKASMSQCYAFNSTSKVTSVNPNFATAPVSGDTYLFIDRRYKVEQGPAWDFDAQMYPHERHRPYSYHPIGDADYGEFFLYPTPDDTYGLQMRYYADLMTLDLAGTLMATLYKRWRNIFIQGVFAKQLQKDDDNRAAAELQAYFQQLNNLLMREQYGLDLSNLQCTVSDY